MRGSWLAIVAMLSVIGTAPSADASTPNVLAYASFLGGADADVITDLAVDPAGNLYVTGQTESWVFPVKNAYQPIFGGVWPTPGVAIPIPNRRSDAFVAKFDPSGALVFSTYLGGSSVDSGRAIAVDAAGNAYIAGVTEAPDFPTTPDAFQRVHMAALDAFVTKFDPNGGLVYSTYLGAGMPEGETNSAYARDWITSIAVDAAGRAIVGGHSNTPEFPTTPDAFQPVKAGLSRERDGVVAALSPDGSTLEFSTFLGGSRDDVVQAVAIAPSGDIVVAGETVSSDLPVTNSAYDTSFGDHGQFFRNGTPIPPSQDVFVSRFDASGSTLEYSTYFGGSVGEFLVDTPESQVYSGPHEQAQGMALDASGDVVIVGYAQSESLPVTPGRYSRRDRTLLVTTSPCSKGATGTRPSFRSTATARTTSCSARTSADGRPTSRSASTWTPRAGSP